MIFSDMHHPRTIGCGVALAALFALACLGCSKKGTDGAADDSSKNDAAELSAQGSIEVTAQLLEILGLDEWKGRFPSNDLGYDYVYVLKYKVQEVHRGKVDGDTLLVGHYNPLKPRAEVADARCPDIGGNLKHFRVGDVHRMALEVPIDDHYMGPIINKYFTTQGEAAIHWAVWTNSVSR